MKPVTRHVRVAKHPVKPRHGSWNRYCAGCRCDACAAACAECGRARRAAKKAGVPFIPPAHLLAPVVDHEHLPFTGKRVLATGTFPTLSRKQVEARIEELGGTVASSVSKNLDLLIAVEKAGSKLAKAETLGVEVMDSLAFEELGR